MANKIGGISDEAAALLSEFFWRDQPIALWSSAATCRCDADLDRAGRTSGG